MAGWSEREDGRRFWIVAGLPEKGSKRLEPARPRARSTVTIDGHDRRRESKTRIRERDPRPKTRTDDNGALRGSGNDRRIPLIND